MDSGLFVKEIAFVEHPTIKMAGCSPDGLVSEDGLIEIKCPTVANHIETLTSNAAPSKYIAQMQWQMACTGRNGVILLVLMLSCLTIYNYLLSVLNVMMNILLMQKKK